MDAPAVNRPEGGGAALAAFLALFGTEPDVQSALGRFLGRPGLKVAYWLDHDERWVDPAGDRVVVDESDSRVALISERDRRVAALKDETPLPEFGESLAAAIRLALENERLQLELHARLEEQLALRRIATVVAGQHGPEEVLALVTNEVASHLAADAAMTARYDGHGVATVVADWSAPGVSHFPVGRQIVIGGPTALARVQDTLKPARVDSYEGMPGDYPAEVRRLGMRAAVAAPILVDGNLWGAVAAGSVGAPFTRDAEARLGAFAELVAQAIANVDARLKLDESRARIVQAADEARRRIERDLHDGAQQRLVAAALELTILAKRLDGDAAGARTVLERAREHLELGLGELRDLARGIHPAVLTERGLQAAVVALVQRAPGPVELTVDVPERPDAGIEAAAYFVVSEALTNVAKYAEAETASVEIRSTGTSVLIKIVDDGIGGAELERGSGLRGLVDRVQAVGGVLDVASPPGEGTQLTARLPTKVLGSLNGR